MSRAQVATMAASEERLRLARELHDSVKQQVFVTSMDIGAARVLLERDRQGAETHLRDAETAIHQVHTDLNALIHELRPAPRTEQGLVMGGTLSIESTPGSGTRITGTCPLQPSRRGKHDG